MGKTRAEQCVCSNLGRILEEAKIYGINVPVMLNIGAGKSTSIEDNLSENNYIFICDRIDIHDTEVTHQFVRNSWQCSVELMTPVESNCYHAAFANYVMEYIPDLHKAAKEIIRVLRPSGIFVTSTPNVKSPEAILSKSTPMWFHHIARRYDRVYEPVYAYKSINELIEIFESAGFQTIEVMYYPHIEFYLERWSPFFGKLGKLYDLAVSRFGIKRLMGDTCLVFKKPSVIKQ